MAQQNRERPIAGIAGGLAIAAVAKEYSFGIGKKVGSA
jgi:hypothetical protein